MPEWGMLPIPTKLVKQGVRDMVRLSDARMSGTSYGACILHVVAGILYRRTARAGEERRPHHARCRRAHHQSRCAAKPSWPDAAPNGSSPNGASSAAMAGCSRATSGRPTKAAISISSKPDSARRSASRRFIDSRRSGAREARTRNLEIPGSMLAHRPGMTTGKDHMTKLSDATRNKLKTVSTATVATALFKRGLRIQCIQDVHPLQSRSADLGRRGLHLRYMPAREDLNKTRCVSRPRPIRSARRSRIVRPARCW